MKVIKSLFYYNISYGNLHLNFEGYDKSKNNNKHININTYTYTKFYAHFNMTF